MRWIFACVALTCLISSSKSSADLNIQPKEFVVAQFANGPRFFGHFDQLNLGEFEVEKNHHCRDIEHYRRFQFIGSHDVTMHIERREYTFLGGFPLVASFENEKACEAGDLTEARFVAELFFQDTRYPFFKVAVAYNKFGRLEIDGQQGWVLLGHLKHTEPTPNPTPIPTPGPIPTPPPAVTPAPVATPTPALTPEPTPAPVATPPPAITPGPTPTPSPFCGTNC